MSSSRRLTNWFSLVHHWSIFVIFAFFIFFIFILLYSLLPFSFSLKVYYQISSNILYREVIFGLFQLQDCLMAPAIVLIYIFSMFRIYFETLTHLHLSVHAQEIQFNLKLLHIQNQKLSETLFYKTG